jgi:uncharacterized protein YijF (DUF1287 family)
MTDLRKILRAQRATFEANRLLIARATLMWDRQTGNCPDSVIAAARKEYVELQKQIVAAGLQSDLDAALQRSEDNRDAAHEAASEATGY